MGEPVTDLPGGITLIKFDAGQHGHRIPELTAMLHESYRPLLDEGMTFWAATQPDDVTLKRLQGGHAFLGFKDDKVVATITIVEADPGGPCDWYNRPEVNHFTQFCVRHQLKGQGIGHALMVFAENYARDNGATEMAMDTSERAGKLIAMYEKWGYRFIGKTKWPDTNYDSVIYSKHLA